MRPLVLGGGLSGLASAFAWSESTRLGPPVLLERSARLGGWVTSRPRAVKAMSALEEEKKSLLFEAGPHSFRTRRTGNGRLVAELVRRLDVEGRAVGASPSAGGRYLWVKDELVRLPSGLIPAMRHPLTRALTYHVVADFLGMSKRSSTEEDETIHAFFARKFGAAFAENVVGGVVAGIFAGDTRSLSLRACFPDLYRLESTVGKGSIVRGALREYWGARAAPTAAPLEPALERLVRAGSVSFPNGLQELVDLLEKHLESKGATLVKNAPVKSLRRSEGRWLATLADARVHAAKDVASTLGVRDLLRVLAREEDPVGVSLLEDLERHVGRVDVAVVNLHYPESQPGAGFGHLVSSAADQAAAGVLGVIYDSVAFPQQQSALGGKGCVLSVMMGGAHAPWIAQEDPSSLVQRAHEAVRRHLGFAESPADVACAVHRDCIPQYRPGHVEAARRAREHFSAKRLHLLGTGAGPGVGIADAIGEPLRILGAP